MPASPASAATFLVTSASDTGPGSLREAIDLANGSPGPDAVAFSIPGNFVIESELPPISDDLGIYGGGAYPQTIQIDHGRIARIFRVSPGVIVSLDFLVITGGRAPTVGSAPGYGGCIYNAGKLTLTQVRVETCLADHGGAIYNASDAELTLDDSRVDSGTALLDGGGIYNSGSLQLSDSILRNGYSNRHGAGIYNSAGASVHVVSSTLEKNVSNRMGGGIFNAGATVTLRDSAVVGNFAVDMGGGILSDGATASVTVRNSTLSGNGISMTSFNGGGAILSTGSMLLIHATVVDNSAPFGSGVAGQFSSKSSIFDNAGENCGQTPGLTMTDLGQNLASDDSCASFGVVSASALKLGPLADNGGLTPTHALLPGSVAIDHATACTDNLGNAVGADQRGQTRPMDGDGDAAALCDSGAYEYADGIFANGFEELVTP
ncbi:MAG TPA: choice-of-anchor Q domain-containing protein [Rhodanobacteraceae bacterium]|nr:choice-of-anchor Q domain-containing protein [Rhodanobacteraceae bacterium]